MTVAVSRSSPITASEPILNDLVEEFANKLQAGEPVDLQAYALEHPDHAEQLLRLLPAVQLMADLGRPPAGGAASEPVSADAASPRLRVLGDYRIVREIGRGGMGVVYEAVQISLGRRVALKVLPLAATLDPKHLQRFKNEAHAAAHLHHTNIVPVISVGCDREVHYYAMQYIDGQSLASVIDALQRPNQDGARSTKDEARTQPEIPNPGEMPPETPPSSGDMLSSWGIGHASFFRTVAQWGVQAAEALAHAHGQGVIHRDIKPANLLVDGKGNLWITDFGLAQCQNHASLTITGEMLGTLRYMSPEQALARRALVDHRTDIYALGATLYELLTLEPALTGRDREELLRQIASEEPRAPRRLNPAIPADLETIVLKAMAKEPGRRYASAGALAEDLQRFLAGQPIQARRVGPVERAGRWCRRNPVVAGLMVAVIAVTLAGFLGVFGQMQVALANEQQAKEERDAVRALNEKLQATQAQLQQTLYAAHLNLAQHAWEAGGIKRVEELLERHRPKPGESDLRGFEWYYLYRLCHSDLLTLKGHNGSVPGDRSVAFSPDGKRLAFASGSHTDTRNAPGDVKVCDAQTGQELLTCKGHTSFVNSVAFSPDGKRLASASRDQTVKVWDAQTGQELLTCKGHPGYVRSVVFSPDGKRLASAAYDEPVMVWDAQTGQVLLSLKGNGRCVAFSPDGKRLASGSDDKTVKVWDVQTGQVLLTLKGHTDLVNSVAYSPDGKRLASAGMDNGGPVKVWDAQTGQELPSLKGRTVGHNNSVAFSPDGRRLASAGVAGVKVWDAQTGQERFTFKGHGGRVTSVVFSPDGTRIASGSNDGTVKIWDATTSPEARTFKGHTGDTRSVAYSPDGKRLASGSSDKTVKVWDAQTGQELRSLEGHTMGVFGVAYSPDGKRLASASGDKTVKVWDAQTGQALFTCKGHTAAVASVAFSPDSTRLASSSSAPNRYHPFADPGEPGEVIVWDAQTGQELLSLKGHRRFVNSVVFSPDGKRLVTLGRDNTKVWDSQTGQEILTLKASSSMAGSVAFSPDGKRLVIHGKVWDAQTGQELLTLEGGAGVIPAVFSPDGKRLASASIGPDRTVKVWDAQTGQELLNLKGGGGRVVFSPDGHRLAGNGPNGTVMIWDATPLPEKP